MPVRRTIIAAALALALFIPSVAHTAPPGSITVPITQTLSGIGTFTGQLVVNSFTTVNGQLAAVGTLSGRLTDTAGNLLGTIVTAVTVPVTNGSGSCSILHLTLGPLDLDLLGLQVHLDRI